MPHYEYKVIPAPVRAEKVKGVKAPEGRFARTIEGELNRMGEAGWEYLRAELLPHEERGGLKAAQTKWRTVLIFRRSHDTETEALQARVLDTPPPDPMPVLPPVVAELPGAGDPPLTAMPEPEEVPNVVPLSPLRGEDDGEDDLPRS